MRCFVRAETPPHPQIYGNIPTSGQFALHNSLIGHLHIKKINNLFVGINYALYYKV